ncbi:hypoxanthine-guanine phosphoribosyltransferases [Mycoplasmopsis californica]|uniref:Hypoxanthine phosphoribosyltransferase n=1 Tax=Mycoplasmopsis equigenitalium TaxID=114883 RepID=A0ABY5J200_9BACT|nr:hypoxanthine phosphoribosyltransferase [Mycoplasmopsis equigenitalium]UUD37280.1 hypoxanthine phosphoribosyltransferase [Mycoplasmopsis equigenitalium]VEU69411.1 hypoxanthine-guanine phosphoribosyltransferases [Mycoplasmopsis californica]
MEKHELVKKVLFTKEELEAKIKTLAEWVNETYKDSNDLIIVGIMKGAMPFMMQLIKDVTVDCVLDFLTVSSYQGGLKTTGNAKVILDMAQDIKDKDVLIVEEIIDSGITLKRINDMLSARRPRSLRIMTLLDKQANRQENINPDINGFVIPNHFVVGFGLDYDEKLRNLPYIGIFDQSKI